VAYARQLCATDEHLGGSFEARLCFVSAARSTDQALPVMSLSPSLD